MEEQAKRINRWRPRFSILTMLLLMTIACMVIALVRLGMVIEPLRQEVEALRAETGRLTIADPTRLHVIGIETAERDYWRWRIYIPFGQRLFLRSQTADIPKVGSPPPSDARHQIEIPSGEYVIEFRIKQPDPDRNLLVGYLRARNEIGSLWQDITIENHKTDWINSRSKSRIEDGGRVGWVGQEEIEPGDSFVLLRLRAGEVQVTEHDDNGKPSTWNYQIAEEPTDGIMLWIDQRMIMLSRPTTRIDAHIYLCGDTCLSAKRSQNTSGARLISWSQRCVASRLFEFL